MVDALTLSAPEYVIDFSNYAQYVRIFITCDFHSPNFFFSLKGADKID
jgi:hypothetical protein